VSHLLTSIEKEESLHIVPILKALFLKKFYEEKGLRYEFQVESLPKLFSPRPIHMLAFAVTYF